MISNEMFGSDIIRVKINGYLKNNTENELITFNEKGIKNKEKISFVFDGVKYSIKINDNDILLVRDGNDFINSFSFNEKHGKSNYYLKEHGYSVNMDIPKVNLCKSSILSNESSFRRKYDKRSQQKHY